MEAHLYFLFFRWYVSRIGRLDAEQTLLSKNDRDQFTQKDGAFLIRPSESSPGEFSLSVKYVMLDYSLLYHEAA